MDRAGSGLGFGTDSSIWFNFAFSLARRWISRLVLFDLVRLGPTIPYVLYEGLSKTGLLVFEGSFFCISLEHCCCDLVSTSLPSLRPLPEQQCCPRENIISTTVTKNMAARLMAPAMLGYDSVQNLPRHGFVKLMNAVGSKCTNAVASRTPVPK